MIIVATWVLLRTRAGNWIFAVGGAQTSARQVGVPVFATKVGLFMTTAFAGWLVGMLSLFKTTTAQSTTGVGQEFIYIICAVVGGCLLTGGYGSAVGAALGALIYGMVGQGIVYAGWDSDWLYAFLGVMLLGAVLVNNWVKSRAEAVAMSAEQTSRRPSRRRQAGTAARPPLPPAGHRRSSRSRTSASRYGSVIALRDVTTTVNAGEVTCVLGRQRRRQVDVHQDPGRRARAHQRRLRRRRREAALLLAARGAGARASRRSTRTSPSCR